MSDAPEPEDPVALERLRAAFAQASIPPGEDEDDGEDTIDPAQIWAAVRGELPVERQRELADRIAADPAFALEWRLAMAMARAEAEAEASAATTDPQPQPPAPANTSRYVAAALILASAAVVLILVQPDDERAVDPHPTDPPAMRDSSTKAALRSTVDDSAPLPREAFTLRWSTEVEASHYELQVTTEDLEPVFSASYVERDELRVPPESLAELPAGTALLWRVVAVEADGTRHASEVWRAVLR